LCFVIQPVLQDKRMVAGAGASEMELSRQLREYGESNATMEQYAILKFAEVRQIVCFVFVFLFFAQALEVVPRILLDNSGVDSTHAIASLVAAHQKAKQTNQCRKMVSLCNCLFVSFQGQPHAGVSVETGQLQDAVKELHVLDSLAAKRSAVQLAVDAAVTILRVDQVTRSVSS
jgi:T-complex protein 1 subunit theta